MPPSSTASSTPSAPTNPMRNARIFSSGARDSLDVVTWAAGGGVGATGRFVRIGMDPTLVGGGSGKVGVVRRVRKTAAAAPSRAPRHPHPDVAGGASEGKVPAPV